MAATTSFPCISAEQYLSSSFEPDVDWVMGAWRIGTWGKWITQMCRAS